MFAKFGGPIEPNDLYATLKEFDLFVLPTLGENFGQVIWEALASGLPLLISDRTPWRNLTEFNIGWDLNLDNPEEFERVIVSMFELTSAGIEKCDLIVGGLHWSIFK